MRRPADLGSRIALAISVLMVVGIGADVLVRAAAERGDQRPPAAPPPAVGAPHVPTAAELWDLTAAHLDCLVAHGVEPATAIPTPGGEAIVSSVPADAAARLAHECPATSAARAARAFAADSGPVARARLAAARIEVLECLERAGLLTDAESLGRPDAPAALPATALRDPAAVRRCHPSRSTLTT